MGRSEAEAMRVYLSRRLRETLSRESGADERRYRVLQLQIRRRMLFELGLRRSRELEKKHLERARQIVDRETELLRRKMEL